MKTMNYLAIFTCCFFLFSCKSSQDNTEQQQNEVENQLSLKHAFQDKFFIGTALNTNQIFQQNEEETALIKHEFNSIVAENCMKGENIHPEEDRYYWEEADAFVAFGEKNNMFIIGHTLMWHSQAPPWLFIDENGNDVSKEILLQRMEVHIKTVVGRYKGRIHGWDVVNEAVADDGSMRNSKFYKILGEDWMEYAFRWAHEADPDAELYYNDYSMSNPAKRNKVIEKVKEMQAKGIQVDGIGMQGHLNLDSPTINAFEESLVKFAELGKVMITELDITVLPWPEGGTSADISLNYEMEEKYNPYGDHLPDSVSTALNNRFIDLFELFNKHHQKIQRVTFWGVADHHSWRNDWPIKGRTDFPLLFNRDLSPKKAYQKIIEIGNEK